MSLTVPGTRPEATDPVKPDRPQVESESLLLVRPTTAEEESKLKERLNTVLLVDVRLLVCCSPERQ